MQKQPHIFPLRRHHHIAVALDAVHVAAVQRPRDLRLIHRLQQIVSRIHVVAVDGEIRRRRHEEKTAVRILLPDPPRRLHAGHTAHIDVEKDDIVACRLEVLEEGLSACKQIRLITEQSMRRQVARDQARKTLRLALDIIYNRDLHTAPPFDQANAVDLHDRGFHRCSFVRCSQSLHAVARFRHLRLMQSTCTVVAFTAVLRTTTVRSLITLYPILEGNRHLK